MPDSRYEHQGVDLHPIYALMNEHLAVRRGSVSGGGNFARALVDAGWRPSGLEDEAFKRFQVRRDLYPGRCVALKDRGIETMYGSVCGYPESEPGSELCKKHVP